MRCRFLSCCSRSTRRRTSGSSIVAPMWGSSAILRRFELRGFTRKTLRVHCPLAECRCRQTSSTVKVMASRLLRQRSLLGHPNRASKSSTGRPCVRRFLHCQKRCRRSACLSLFSAKGAPSSVVGDILPLGKTCRADKTASQNSHRSAAGSLENLAHHCDPFHVIGYEKVEHHV